MEHYDNESDSTYVEDYDSEADEWFQQFEYEPEELSVTKNNIVICQAIDGTYLTHIRLKQFDYDAIRENYRDAFYYNGCKLEIAKCDYLPSGECVAILKTFWIRIIQRAWKRVYKKHKQYLANCKNLFHRETFGKFPTRLPGLYGLLSSLRRPI